MSSTETTPDKVLTLYERIGGAVAVDAAVDVFYRKVLADYRINRFFDDINMDKQAAKQKAFFTMAFGGPNTYTGKDLRNAHARLVMIPRASLRSQADATGSMSLRLIKDPSSQSTALLIPLDKVDPPTTCPQPFMPNA